MRTRPLFQAAIVLGLYGSLLVSHVLDAATLPTEHLRPMSVAADLIVVGEPLDTHAQHIAQKYKILEVLKGAGVAEGDEITLSDVGLYSQPGSSYVRNPKNEQTPPRFPKALLFLKHQSQTKSVNGFGVIPSGIRVLDGKGDLLVPVQFNNPGGYCFTKSKTHDWDAMLNAIRSDLREIAGLRGFGLIEDHGLRNQTIFRWLERHKAELTRPSEYIFTYSEKSWGPLDGQLFDWILESCLPADCWKAIVLAVELKFLRRDEHPSATTSSRSDPAPRRRRRFPETRSEPGKDRGTGSIPRRASGQAPFRAYFTFSNQVSETSPLLLRQAR